jgi:hypothetical protein
VCDGRLFLRSERLPVRDDLVRNAPFRQELLEGGKPLSGMSPG